MAKNGIIGDSDDDEEEEENDDDDDDNGLAFVINAVNVYESETANNGLSIEAEVKVCRYACISLFIHTHMIN